jgi:hypothetical protein
VRNLGLAKLQATPDDNECAHLVESALRQAAAELHEGNASLERALAIEKATREERQPELALMTAHLEDPERALAESAGALEKKDEVLSDLQQETQKQSQGVRETVSELIKERQDREEMGARLKQVQPEKAHADRNGLQTAKIMAVAFGVLAILAFEVVINFIFPWNWLLLHPASYGLQACISLMLFFAILGVFVRPWKKALWLSGGFGVAVVLLQLLGGPAPLP